MAGIEEVLALAREVQGRAHAPYSGFRVGAVLETRGRGRLRWMQR